MSLKYLFIFGAFLGLTSVSQASPGVGLTCWQGQVGGQIAVNADIILLTLQPPGQAANVELHLNFSGKSQEVPAKGVMEKYEIRNKKGNLVGFGTKYTFEFLDADTKLFLLFESNLPGANGKIVTENGDIIVNDLHCGTFAP